MIIFARVYNQTLRKIDDNDFSVDHTGVRKPYRQETLERRIKYKKVASENTYACMTSSPSDGEDDNLFIFLVFQHFFPREKGVKYGHSWAD